jgi:hypothetical protein
MEAPVIIASENSPGDLLAEIRLCDGEEVQETGHTDPLEYIALTRSNIAAFSAFAEFSAKLEDYDSVPKVRQVGPKPW